MTLARCESRDNMSLERRMFFNSVNCKAKFDYGYPKGGSEAVSSENQT